MGQWNMSIQGHGIHDNGLENDAEVMLERFVDELRAAGHSVSSVHFTVGAARKQRTVRTNQDGDTTVQWVDASVG